MVRIREDLLTDKKFAAYADLSEAKRALFSKNITASKSAFYDAYDLRAADFRKAMRPAFYASTIPP